MKSRKEVFNLNKKFKFLIITMLILTIMSSLNLNVYAADGNGIIDQKNVEDTYKFSDDKSEIYLPFIRSSSNRVVVDRDVNKSGIIMSKGPIDVTSKLNGIDFLLSSDTVRVNAATTYPVIFADNVVIDSKVDKTTVIIANNITVTANAEISEDLICFGNTLNMLGKIDGNLIGRVDTTNISGTIMQDMRIKTGALKLYDSARILKNIYVVTSNKDVDLSDKYSNANVVYQDNSTGMTFGKLAQAGIVTSMLFALLYIVIDKLSNNKKTFTRMLSNAKNHPIALIISGLLSIMLMPMIFAILLILSMSWLSVITVPLIIVYISIFIITIILSSFIIGSMIYDYLNPKYFSKYTGFWYTFLKTFVIYLVLYILCKIPLVGSYISMFIVMIAQGIVVISIFKSNIGDKQLKNNQNSEEIKADNIDEKKQ